MFNPFHKKKSDVKPNFKKIAEAKKAAVPIPITKGTIAKLADVSSRDTFKVAFGKTAGHLLVLDMQSPMAKALIGKKIGAVVTFTDAKGDTQKVKVLDVTKIV